MFKAGSIFFLVFLFLPGLAHTQESIVLEEIKLTGDSRLKLHVVQLKSGIYQGDTLAKDKIKLHLDAAAKELSDMRILDSVSWQLSGPDRQKILTWYLKKSINFFFVPYVEAADRDINVWLDRFDAAPERLNYGGLVYLFNLFGHNDVLDLTLTTGFNQDYELFYFLPNIDKEGKWSGLVKTEYQAFQDIAFLTIDNKEVFAGLDDRGSLFKQWTGKIGLQYRLKSRQWVEGSFAFSHRSMDRALYKLNSYFLNSGRQIEQEYRFGLRHIADTRDNRRFPTSGYRCETLLQYAFYTGEANDVLEGLLRANYYVKLDQLGLLALGMRGRMQMLQNPYGYRFSRAIGFDDRIVRGYELYSVPAANYWLLKADYRYPFWNMEPFLNKLSKRAGVNRDIPVLWYFNAFADMARAYRDYQNHHENDLVGPLLSGAGVGIDVLVFRRFLFSLQYSWNHLGESGVFVHFSFNRE
ncbi:MAG TPA: BamA/TamA family outer membrane protein [Saprospiraceae bacterium]|nr:BamA/TamA family outer membrane protein [Saprospiraceae bacterium]